MIDFLTNNEQKQTQGEKKKCSYTTLVLDKLSFLTHECLVLCPTGSSFSWSSISAVLVMKDGLVCITISGTKLSCPGEYLGFGIGGVCWMSSSLSSFIFLQHF